MTLINTDLSYSSRRIYIIIEEISHYIWSLLLMEPLSYAL